MYSDDTEELGGIIREINDSHIMLTGMFQDRARPCLVVQLELSFILTCRQKLALSNNKVSAMNVNVLFWSTGKKRSNPLGVFSKHPDVACLYVQETG